MQKTKFSKINQQFNELLFGFLSSSWKSKSINIIFVLTGYFLFSNFVTKFISEGRQELIMVPILILIIELFIRIRPSANSSLFNLWSIVDKARIGATYAVVLEAFKLGS